MKPTITVIVPMYNVEKYVKTCLSSLIQQKYKNFIVFAISDGSPDNSIKIAEKLAEKDDRIKVMKKKNGGYGSVLDYAIKRVSTDYFLICDPDDWLDENALDVLYKYAVKNDLDITVGDKFNVYENSKKKEFQATFSEDLNIVPNKIYTRLSDIQKFAFGSVSPHAKLYKTKIARYIKLPSYVSYTDFELYILCLANAKKVAYINKPLAYYLLDREGNTNTTVKPSIINDYLVVWKSTMNQLSNYNEINGLCLMMFIQLKNILSEYSRVTDITFKDKYFKQICSYLAMCRQYRRQILSFKMSNFTLASKILNHLLLNKYSLRLAAKCLVKRDKKKMLRR